MSIVIIGGGQAAASIAQKFRSLDQDTPMTILAEEYHPPYQRPPLSKKYLAGEMELERLFFKPKDWYEGQNIDLRLGAEVVALDRDAKAVTTADGDVQSYEKLVFATGSSPRMLPKNLTQNAPNIYAVRGLGDIDAMLKEFQDGRKLLVIGGGYIGLEAAAVARKFGLDVTLIEAAPRILGRVASQETAEFMRDLHIKHGVKILENTGLKHFEFDDGSVVGAYLSNQEEIAVDFVIVGIGIKSNDDIANAAGILCDNGILVDEYCRTNDENIYAAGDCTRFDYHGAQLRLESVGNAIDQGNVVGANLAGEPARYTPKPWFWSDQYDLSLQIAGFNGGYQEVVTRAGEKPESLSVWYYDGQEQLLAVDAMNEPKVYMIAKRVIEAGKNIPKTAAADPTVDLKAFI